MQKYECNLLYSLGSIIVFCMSFSIHALFDNTFYDVCALWVENNEFRKDIKQAFVLFESNHES